MLLWILGNSAIALALIPLAWLAGRLHRPALAHVIWLLIIFKLLTPPLWRIPIFASNEAPAVVAPTVPVVHAAAPITIAPPVVKPIVQPTATFIPPPPSPRPIGFADILVPIWIAGSVGMLILSIVRIQRFRALLRSSNEPNADLRDQVNRLARRIGLSEAPEIRVIDATISPMLWFLWQRPTLVLPAAMMSLPPQRREGVILHELAHQRRLDHWVRLLELLATSLLWWHPLLWLARRGLREAEDNAATPG